jgi:prevent-host-death family protein
MNSRDVKTFSEHAQRLREHLDRVRATGRPLVVTTDGKPDAVVLSPENYEELLADAEYARHLRAIEQSIEEFERGEGIPVEESLAKVRKILGIEDEA